jgi:hypothetical protein
VRRSLVVVLAVQPGEAGVLAGPADTAGWHLTGFERCS